VFKLRRVKAPHLVWAANRRNRDLDISVHFNAYVETEKPMGCEVLYVTQDELAEDVCSIDRGRGRIDQSRCEVSR
jgi:hypothetical protein